ncbi:MAG: TraB/GumN family protein [Nitrospirota bacterium]
MKKNCGIFLFAGLILFILSLWLPAQNAFSAEKTFLWKVRAEANTIYILGSLHFMKKDAYPLDRSIEDAFGSSDVLVVEANINDIARIDIGKLMDTAFYAGDDTLQNHVSPDTYDLVKKEYEKIGIPISIVSRQRPWFLALTLTSFELVNLGFDPSYGIEAHFISKATGRKRIEELESFEYQINLLSGFSDWEQEMFLLYTLKDVNSFDENADNLLQAWKTGDVKRLESIALKNISDDGRLSSVYEKLIYERNRNMTTKIESFLRKKETYFVVVGAGHLVGEKGIIETLKRKGYSVQQI